MYVLATRRPGCSSWSKGAARRKWSPSGATAAAVAGEEEEAEEEGEEGEEEDAPKGKLKELPGDYPFARQQDCDLRLFDFEAFGGFGKEGGSHAAP